MYFSFLLFILLISHIISNDICNLDIECNKCDECEQLSECNFYNVFCKRNSSVERLPNLHNNLTNLFKSNTNIDSFCNSRSIALNSVEDSFTLFESSSEKIQGTKPILYSCEYFIINKYYFDHETDQAKLNIEIRSQVANVPNDSQLKFDIIIIYNSYGEYRLNTLSDESIRGKYYSRFLDKLSDIEILIDFYNNSTNSILETLIIDIETDNPSEKVKIIYLAIIIILAFFILVIIALIIVYFFLKRKIMREREQIAFEEEEKNRHNKKLIENFLKDELKIQTFSDKIKLNDCDTCTICFDNFVIGESKVSITPCLHVFHHECIEKWIKEKIINPLCPNCKFSFLEYMENRDKIKGEKKETLNINNFISQNNDIKDNNTNIKSNEDNNNRIQGNNPPSEEIRINPVSVRSENNNNINSINNNNININNNQNNEEASVHVIVEDEENNNN